MAEEKNLGLMLRGLVMANNSYTVNGEARKSVDVAVPGVRMMITVTVEKEYPLQSVFQSVVSPSLYRNNLYWNIPESA